MAKLTPSPAITVSTHATITETLEVMKAHQVGAVLVTDYQHPQRLMGIFTERDLLKWSLELKKPEQWNLAISNLMTKNPTCLSLLELDQAAEKMAALGRRHLPITYIAEDGETHLAGVVSIRDLFLQLLSEKKSTASNEVEQELRQQKVVALAKDPHDQKLQEKLLGNYHEVEAMSEPNFTQIQNSNLFVFDLDHYSVQVWAKTLKEVLDTPHHPRIILVYSPAHQDQNSLKTIQTLAQGKVVYTFLKPIRVLDYLDVVRRCLNPKD